MTTKTTKKFSPRNESGAGTRRRGHWSTDEKLRIIEDEPVPQIPLMVP